ncbi:hypothetical protein [Vibrio hangzhouensis]|uniref:hypothetical protein n=1 Tax=Vibrio hangzhouensis TaxID=462991 RepID=UPI001C93CF0F|nr:hypothetical protein [Vibrio hangzhouensis]MBY6196102.1 hypothetical protein [Vibrio hangzhouensis]
MTYPNAMPHGNINQVMSDIYMVTGSVALKAPHPKWGPLSLVFSRNMYVVKQGDELTLINSVRLNDKGMAQLDQLGDVKHIIRLAAFHGLDDPFYRETFGATLWSVDAPYVRGFGHENRDEYYRADKVLHAGGELPIRDASYYEFSTSTPKEGLILLEKESGILISGDSMQNWAKPDQYFNWFARLMMPRMGFIAPTNFGPGWLKMAKPDVQELVDKASLKYDALLPAHGTPVLEGAREGFIASANAVKS